jgi:arachidonate 5-lipoxygenase
MYTSIGVEGFHTLIRKYWSSRDLFQFNDLDPLYDFRRRGVNDEVKLPGYLYRDDAVRLWNILKPSVYQLLSIFYHTDDDVRGDSEIQVDNKLVFFPVLF